MKNVWETNGYLAQHWLPQFWHLLMFHLERLLHLLFFLSSSNSALVHRESLYLEVDFFDAIGFLQKFLIILLENSLRSTRYEPRVGLFLRIFVEHGKELEKHLMTKTTIRIYVCLSFVTDLPWKVLYMLPAQAERFRRNLILSCPSTSSVVWTNILNYICF